MKACLHNNLQTNAPKNKTVDKCKNLYTNILALHLTAKMRQPPKRPSAGDWINKREHCYTKECYLDTKRTKSDTCYNMDNLIPKGSQTKKGHIVRNSTCMKCPEKQRDEWLPQAGGRGVGSDC